MLRITFATIFFVFAGPSTAQEIQQSDKDYTLNVDVQLVQLPVSVLDKDGRPISGLRKDDFQLFEDGVQQDISLFTHEDIPLSVGLVIDNSGSMRNKRARVNSAALTFARESNPQDETFIVNFDDEVYLEQDFTNNIHHLVAALRHLDSRGATTLYDAVYLSAQHLDKGQKEKKALLLITDGEDNKSTYSLGRVLRKLRESKATVYTIGLLEEDIGWDGLFGKSPSKKARGVLEKFSATTGGRAYFPKSIDEISELCRRIARDIRNQYTLAYKPTNSKRDGTWRKITVRLNAPRSMTKLTVRAKEGYYAPKS